MTRIILASGSPRRRELLERYNLNINVIESNINEKINFGETPEQIAMSLALQKALYVSKDYPDDIVIGADTIVVNMGQILGKPMNDEDAYIMLKNLSGRTHYVITGISILSINSNIKIIDYESTLVKFKDLSDGRINNYIKSGEPMDKAGSYDIQGLGAILVENIDGCYSNVVGLPLSKIDYLLSRFFNLNIM